MRVGVCFLAGALAALALLGCKHRASESLSGFKAEFAPNGVPTDWGQVQPRPGRAQSPEALLANEAARRLNVAADLGRYLSGLKAGQQPVDATVSVPVMFRTNDDDSLNHPFGDGQKNASLGWVGWQSETLQQVPLVATLVRFDSESAGNKASLIVIEVAQAVALTESSSAPASLGGNLQDASGNSLSLILAFDETKAVYRAVVLLEGWEDQKLGTNDAWPAEIVSGPSWLWPLENSSAWPRVRLGVWVGQEPQSGQASAYWPLLFRFPAQSLEQGLRSLPEDHRLFQGRPVTGPPYSPESGQGKTPDQALQAWLSGLGSGQNLVSFFPAVAGAGVHHQFKANDGKVAQTATGGVDTYVVNQKVGNNQILYTCFDARNTEAEGADQWGVPSGAGWHSIGHELGGQPQANWTFAETIVNGFDRAGIFAGWGVRTPYPFDEPAPFGAKDVVTFRVLRAGELYTTAKGHFHWYAVDASRKVCTTIWKHLGCALKSDLDLRCGS